MSEQSDLEALRQEKRAIQLEERRLKALLDIEKAKAARAADRQAAARAERHRRQAKVDYRRDKVPFRPPSLETAFSVPSVCA